MQKKSLQRTIARQTNPEIRARDRDSQKRYLKTEKGRSAKRSGDAAYRERNRERIRRKARDWKLKKRYGLTREQFDAIVDNQGGKCPICNCNIDLKRYQYAVDHCHDSGELRGVICKTCNRGLGLLGDSVQGIEAALAYLKNPPIKQQLTEISCAEN